ncbi:hypothetical protein ACFWXH_13890 [Mesorhizobium sp. NPDC059054]|uniref:hypothetical protein n=1 Tax=Mesorhizobium sp. NPDC059054 TaxID=3346711 RepID=UPI0036A1C84B
MLGDSGWQTTLIDTAREIAASLQEGEVFIYMLDLAKSEVLVLAERSQSNSRKSV